MSSTRTEISCGTKGTNTNRESRRMRPPPDCRPSVGASAPKGTCRWLSPFCGSAVRTALNYNYHRAAVESFADDLNTRRGIVSGRVALLPRS
ncbi:unnamed protein product, partial [Brassica rapa subsp. narinosa]